LKSIVGAMRLTARPAEPGGRVTVTRLQWLPRSGLCRAQELATSPRSLGCQVAEGVAQRALVSVMACRHCCSVRAAQCRRPRRGTPSSPVSQPLRVQSHDHRGELPAGRAESVLAEYRVPRGAARAGPDPDQLLLIDNRRRLRARRPQDRRRVQRKRHPTTTAPHLRGSDLGSLTVGVEPHRGQATPRSIRTPRQVRPGAARRADGVARRW